MTALSEYQRLEAAGLWRGGPGEQRRDVIVSMGDATLVITDLNDRPLAHWSLGALMRSNPGEFPAIFHPDGDPGETLELSGDETAMIQSLDRVLASVEKRRPKKGRLRGAILALILAVIVGAGLFWLPGALRSHALSVLPQVKRDEIGRLLLAEVQRLTGPHCDQPGGQAALDRMAQRLSGQAPPARLHVVPSALQTSLHLPGRIVLLGRAVVEDFEDPEVSAGYVVAELARARTVDPVLRLLDQTGPGGVLRLLTTGDIPEEDLRRHAEALVATAPAELSDEALLDAFRRASVRSTPYAYAVDPTGEAVLGLIEADPFPAGAQTPVLPDSAWLRLQAICGG